MHAALQVAATIAAQTVLHSSDNRKYKVSRCPGPDDVNWPSLWMTHKDRNKRRPITSLLYLLVMMVPLGVFAGMTTQVRITGPMCAVSRMCGVSRARSAACP